MTEVNIQNFENYFPDIKKSLEKAKFISIDLEFSALNPLKEHSPSLFDNPTERYQKLRKNIQFVVPVQIGLTAFTFNPDTNTYVGTIYNFYVAPASFPFVEKQFLFQSDTLNFLKFYGFDFNKFAYSGIPYINRDQEKELRQRFRNHDVTEVQSLFRVDIAEILNHEGQQVQQWYSTAKEGDTLSIPKMYEKYENNHQITYFLHKNFRQRFKNVWTFSENKEFVLKKMSPVDIVKLNNTHNLEEKLVDDILGFSKLFRLLVSLQKPLIGHNIMQDILILIQCFETPLPHCYKTFKKLANNLFPKIFDTKTISYELRTLVPEKKRWDTSSLESIFKYFKDGTGRHLAINSPAIESNCVDNFGKYHEAGWDSFCTGYIFIRLAYFNVYQKYPKSKNFMSTELIAGLEHCKNKVNVIRGAVSSIKIDGEDPVSTRPPYLVVESIKNLPLNISQFLPDCVAGISIWFKHYPHRHVLLFIETGALNAQRYIQDVLQKAVVPYAPFVGDDFILMQDRHCVRKVSSILSSFGFVEIRRFPYQSKRALIVVDNFTSVRRIEQNFKTNSDFRIKPYSFLKHSPVIRVCLLGGMTISGIILIWMTRSAIKR